MNLKSLLSYGYLLALTCSGNWAMAASGHFSTLSYNVAGLLEPFSSAESDRQSATEMISCYVNDYDFVNVQEDFNYHAALYDTCNNHPYRSPTSGGMAFGSGLNSMSRFTYQDWTRVKWDACNGIDCFTPKGFTLARTQLAEGVFVDIYNLHTQAQVGDADLKARRANILQLANYIENHSAGNAVIVMGDTNTRYTRSGDNIRELINRGFKDAWIELLRDGNIPASGEGALTCKPYITSADCEIVDKVLYRDGDFVKLDATHYEVRIDDITDEGLKLSDHPPVQTNFTFTTLSNRRFSDTFGGPHGVAFNDITVLPTNSSISSISLFTGSRVDRIDLRLDNGNSISHGGSGGNAETLSLGKEEYLNYMKVCSGKKDNHTRIFYTRLTTNQDRSIAGGTQTSNCKEFHAPERWQIIGFHGRSGNEIDKIGVIYGPI